MLPRVPWLRALPPREESSGAAMYRTTPNGLWTTVTKRPSCPRHAAGIACFQSTVACYRGACKTCRYVAIVWFNSATQTQLTTPRHGDSGDTTRHDGTTAWAMFSIAG
jgi:hypothetical protein